jgi:phosphopantetheine adenylyltransferase
MLQDGPSSLFSTFVTSPAEDVSMEVIELTDDCPTTLDHDVSLSDTSSVHGATQISQQGTSVCLYLLASFIIPVVESMQLTSISGTQIMGGGKFSSIVWKTTYLLSN